MSLIKSAVTTTAQAVGFAKGLAESGIDVVRRRGAAPEPEAAAPQPSVEPTRAPEPDLPGPDIVLAAVPDPDELPEPIVIEADDHPGANGEAFQTEPKATTRADSVGGFQGDEFEAEDEADEALEELTEPRA
jgi:hypothetical protein